MLEPHGHTPLDRAAAERQREILSALSPEARRYVGWSETDPDSVDLDRLRSCISEMLGLMIDMTGLGADYGVGKFQPTHGRRPAP